MGTWKIANSRAGTPSASLSSTTIKYRQRHRRHLDMAITQLEANHALARPRRNARKIGDIDRRIRKPQRRDRRPHPGQMPSEPGQAAIPPPQGLDQSHVDHDIPTRHAGNTTFGPTFLEEAP